jgi:hypothetical protein
MSVLNLEDVIVEAATQLALNGECDLPIDNKWGGVDLVAPGYYEFYNRNVRGLRDGVRLSIEDGVIHIWKFENWGVAASASFKGEVISSGVLVAVAKEWLA